MKSGKVPTADGQKIMQQLDAISYAVNTQDLNQFEVQTIKRRLTKVLAQIEKLTA
jgi:homoserine acetyltransferase